MSSQASVPVAKMIDLQQRIRRADDTLDRVITERNRLAAERNALDPFEFRGTRSLSPVPEPITREQVTGCKAPHCWSEYGTECDSCPVS